MHEYLSPSDIQHKPKHSVTLYKLNKKRTRLISVKFHQVYHYRADMGIKEIYSEYGTCVGKSQIFYNM